MRKYRIVANNHNQEAILDTKTNQYVSRWWNEICECGLVQGRSEYYIAMQRNTKQSAIFHKDDPRNPISQWWKDIYEDGLVNGQSEYYIARNQNEQEAIFHKDNPQEPISQWWKTVKSYGVVEGKSEYYIVQNQNEQEAIFHIDNPYEPISQWWNSIDSDGFVRGESEYYIAHYNTDKQAIFHIENPNQPISQLWNNICTVGLIEGQSEYYIVQNQYWQHAIFHKDNPDEPITNWHKYIFPFGLINNTSEYYAVIDKEASAIKIYHPINLSQPLYELPNDEENLLLYFNDKHAIYLADKHIVIYDSAKMIYEEISSLPKGLQKILQDIEEYNSSYRINIVATNQLISQYINDGFLPIVVQQFMNNDHYYLFNTNGAYIGKFNNVKQMTQYIQQEISRKKLSCDMIRLY